MVKKRNSLDITINIILILLVILIVYWWFQLMFGGSPTIVQFNSILIVMIIGFLFKFNREFGEFKVKTVNSFDNIKQDINGIRQDVGEIKDIIKKK